jgi:hypothetical protein
VVTQIGRCDVLLEAHGKRPLAHLRFRQVRLGRRRIRGGRTELECILEKIRNAVLIEVLLAEEVQVARGPGEMEFAPFGKGRDVFACPARSVGTTARCGCLRTSWSCRPSPIQHQRFYSRRVAGSPLLPDLLSNSTWRPGRCAVKPSSTLASLSAFNAQLYFCPSDQLLALPVRTLPTTIPWSASR